MLLQMEQTNHSRESLSNSKLMKIHCSYKVGYLVYQKVIKNSVLSMYKKSVKNLTITLDD